MIYVVSYDIPDDRRRNRVAKRLKDFGYRVQYSVFECDLEAAQLRRLRLSLEKLIKAEEDSIRVYSLCQNCQGEVVILGQGRLNTDPDFYVV